MATSVIKANYVTACNVAAYGKYLDQYANQVAWPPYYIAEIPVQEGYYINVFNSANNSAAYSFFYNVSGTKVGNGIGGRNDSKGFGQYYQVPTGAVSLKVTMYADDRNVLSSSLYSNPDA